MLTTRSQKDSVTQAKAREGENKLYYQNKLSQKHIAPERGLDLMLTAWYLHTTIWVTLECISSSFGNKMSHVN